MTPAVAGAAEHPQSIWQRYGWLYSGIWLVFLVFPLAAAVTAPVGPVQRAVTIGLMVAFAAVYLRGFLLQDRLSADAVVPMVWRYLAAMAGLALLTVPTVGVEALGMAAFMCSFAIFGLPIRHGFGVPSIFAVVVLVVSLFTSWWVLLYLLPIGLVTVATGMVRVFEQAEHEAVDLRLQQQLAADRDRVARDVHDVLGHSLTVVAVKAELAGRLVDDDPERAKDELAEIQTLTRTALGEIRATVGGLRATRLADEVESARAALSAAGVHLDAPDDPDDVEPRARVALAWVLREAVTNVVRHSGASRVDLRWGPSWLEVVDDGHGRRGAREGNGLAGLRERIAALGGHLQIGDGPDGAGTRVRVDQS